MEHDVVICGGGIQAASIAYHLTLRGALRNMCNIFCTVLLHCLKTHREKIKNKYYHVYHIVTSNLSCAKNMFFYKFDIIIPFTEYDV